MSRVTIVTDLGFGDAGKGSIVDYLARSEGATTVVRYNGGAQAAHNVHTPDGRHHTFQQFGSGTFVPGVATHLSRFMLVSPLNLFEEAQRLTAVGVPDALTRLTIDDQAMVVTPYHRAANRLRELARGDGRHGSCGEGIGETMSDSIDHPELTLLVGDLRRPRRARRLLEEVRAYKLVQLADVMAAVPSSALSWRHFQTFRDTRLSDEVVDFYLHFAQHVQIVNGEHLHRQLARPGHIVFEGAQGVLLDEWYGFHPYTTWSTTTPANARRLLAEAGYAGNAETLGLLRAYHTRHGAGPFVTEDARLTAALPDPTNAFNPWQRDFRVGYFDLVAARYALEVSGGIDALAITCLDRLYGVSGLQVGQAYHHQGHLTHRLAPKTKLDDLDYQEALTRQLLESAPVYQQFQTGAFGPGDVARYTGLIGQTLGVPVILTSTGSTALDKQTCRPQARAA
jgi:adenylosuccinate synthase